MLGRPRPWAGELPVGCSMGRPSNQPNDPRLKAGGFLRSAGPVSSQPNDPRLKAGGFEHGTCPIVLGPVSFSDRPWQRSGPGLRRWSSRQLLEYLPGMLDMCLEVGVPGVKE